MCVLSDGLQESHSGVGRQEDDCSSAGGGGRGFLPGYIRGVRGVRAAMLQRRGSRWRAGPCLGHGAWKEKLMTWSSLGGRWKEGEEGGSSGTFRLLTHHQMNVGDTGLNVFHFSLGTKGISRASSLSSVPKVTKEKHRQSTFALRQNM